MRGRDRAFGARTIVIAALMLLACSGSFSSRAGSSEGDAGVAAPAPAAVLPPGGVCAPSTATAVASIPDEGGVGPDGAVSSSSAGARCGADGGYPVRFDGARPLGFGYPDLQGLLPPHVAYLTFDDGPSDWTNDFLDILKSRGVHGTFFVTAKQLKGESGLDGTYVDEYGHTWAYRDLVKRELDEGHVVGNHTVYHPDLAGITPAQVRGELDEDEYLINVGLVRAGGTPHVLTLFRPPYGSPWFHGKADPPDLPVAQEAAGAPILSHGLNTLWTVDSTDTLEWAIGESYSRTIPEQPLPGAPTYAEKVTRILTTVMTDPTITSGRGVIILFHDTHDTTRDVLARIIDGLVAGGYTFSTIEDLAQVMWGRPSIDLTPGPSTFDPCVDERDWGCASFGTPVGTDRANEVCGRMWLAYQALGGFDALGSPTGAPQTTATGAPTQSFEHGSIELHPENPPPCNVVLVAR